MRRYARWGRSGRHRIDPLIRYGHRVRKAAVAAARSGATEPMEELNGSRKLQRVGIFELLDGKGCMNMQTETNNRQVSIILCGVGGQGTILASRLIADAAMRKGIHVRSAETIGMAQRGGSVFTNLRLGEDAPTPRIGLGKADLMIAFEPAEAVRMLPWLKKDGAAVVSMEPIIPVSAMVGASSYPADDIIAYLKNHVKRLTLVDSAQAAADLGSAKCLNVVLLGAAVRSGALGLTGADVEEAIRRRLPEKLQDLNRRALAYTA